MKKCTYRVECFLLERRDRAEPWWPWLRLHPWQLWHPSESRDRHVFLEVPGCNATVLWLVNDTVLRWTCNFRIVKSTIVKFVKCFMIEKFMVLFNTQTIFYFLKKYSKNLWISCVFVGLNQQLSESDVLGDRKESRFHRLSSSQYRNSAKLINILNSTAHIIKLQLFL